jgi:hypothetical protein
VVVDISSETSLQIMRELRAIAIPASGRTLRELLASILGLAMSKRIRPVRFELVLTRDERKQLDLVADDLDMSASDVLRRAFKEFQSRYKTTKQQETDHAVR